MKEIEFYVYCSRINRDGNHSHVMLIDGVKAVCGADGVSFIESGRFKRHLDGSFSEIRPSGIMPCANPISCQKCLAKLSHQLDEYKKPVKVAEDQYRYMGHFIDDQREDSRLPPWVTIADIPGAVYVPHWSFAQAKAHCKANRVDNPELKLKECFG